MSDAQPYYLKDDGVIPNSALPLLLYPQVIDAAHADRASTFEQRFAQKGWTHTWRNGIYSFPHYHSTAHEVLGIACGSARVRLSGDGGVVLDVKAEDALLLPAGVGHQNLGARENYIKSLGFPCRRAIRYTASATDSTNTGPMLNLQRPAHAASTALPLD